MAQYNHCLSAIKKTKLNNVIVQKSFSFKVVSEITQINAIAIKVPKNMYFSIPSAPTNVLSTNWNLIQCTKYQIPY